MKIVDLLLGRPLANDEYRERKMGWFEGVPALGLDGLGSSSYGPEAALTVLMPLGAAGLIYLGPVVGLIIGLLIILYFSYRQTIAAYPTNGGGYTVARANLGANAGLLAAAALMIDYVLNVAVGVSAGVGALVSALPALHDKILPLCILIVVIVTIANLRGTREAGWYFALPTYLFVACFVGVIGYGVFNAAISGGSPQPLVPPPPLPPPTEAMSIWLLMHAFASGCTAMTGVEAVSNGVRAFKEPVVKNARVTLTIIVGVLGLLLAGIAMLARVYHVGAMDQNQADYQSVLSQIVAAVSGRGTIYYIAMSSLLCVLCLSANTSFVDFPRLCRNVAADGYLPRSFAIPGRRLVFTVGILFLSGVATLLLLLFGGITDRLIPLFAIGAFLTFSMSQWGMVQHWRRQPGDNRVRLLINAVGATASSMALAIILAAKFTAGAWITVLVIPLVIVLLKSIRSYYDALDMELREDGPIVLEEIEPPLVVVVTQTWNRLTDKAIKFALTISPDVFAVHLQRLEGPDSEENERAIREQWRIDVEEPVAARGLNPPRLLFVSAPFRQMHEPLLQLTEKLDAETPGRSVAVLIPETVKTHWWQHLLHNHRASRLRHKLLRHGGPRLIVVSVPWRLSLEMDDNENTSKHIAYNSLSRGGFHAIG